MRNPGRSLAEEARARAYSTPLEDFQPHAIDHASDTLWPWFERLRAEDPVHYGAQRIRPLLVDHPIRRHRRLETTLSSSQAHGGILVDPPEGVIRRSARGGAGELHALDPPADAQRKAVSPMTSTPSLAELEPR